LTDFAGHPLVVGVVPGQPPLVAITAASMARATGAPALYFAYVDTSRYPDVERPDGTVHHLPIDPDLADDSWMDTERALIAEVGAAMSGVPVPWQLRYLAGRVDRSLTHLARAVDAAAFVVGTHVGSHRRLADFVNRSVSMQLAHRQHRPVLVVPLTVVDWQAKAPWA
jgi:nucleotide-binding universal stress UspA family protein